MLMLMSRPTAFGLIAVLCLVLTGEHLRAHPETVPTVTDSKVPFYPRICQAAGIEGVVELQVSTDGQKPGAIEIVKGQPMLARAAKENVASWQFEPHAPTTFGVKFQYSLLPALSCEQQTQANWLENRLVLRLPTEVHVTAQRMVICDPVVPNRKKK
jgi:hypothetical protein